MTLPKILVSGKFGPRDLTVSVSESTRKIDPEVEGKLESVWNARVRYAKEQEKILYNGLSYRLNSVKEDNDRVVLDFGIIDFKTREGLVAIPEYFLLPEEYYRMGCGVCASIKTVDDKYLMIELSGRSMNQNDIDLIGGIMETVTGMESGANIFYALYKEMEEEAGIMHEDIQTCYLRTIYVTDKSNAMFYFEVVLQITAQEVFDRFVHNKDQDIRSVIAYSRDEYVRTLQTHENLNKQFIAGLLQV